MVGCGHLGDGRQARGLLRLAEPDESLLSPALEGVGAGTGLPDAATQHLHLRDLCQGLCRGEDLRFAFYAAGAGDKKRRNGGTKP